LGGLEIMPGRSSDIDVRVAGDLHALSVAAAEAMVQVIAAAAGEAGTCSLALSGGGTPRELYRLLASRFREQIPWERVHIFWGDERYVPHDHPDSNYGMARDTLLDHVPCPKANIHPMPTHVPTPEAAAGDYERTLKDHFGNDGPPFDVNLLGLGADGHTASIFPGSPALRERTRWVMSAQSNAAPVSRLTLTLPALIQSANIFVLVAGANKASALKQAVSASADVNACPAAGLRDARGRVIWFVDREAASELATSRRDDVRGE